MSSNTDYRRKISNIKVSSAALVVGNGPSAKMVDYESHWIRKITTVGMNSAFRYWDQVGFRPTFYICMDDVVIKNIAKDIHRLIEENKIELFFLKDAIKDLFPDLADHPKIIWHSDVINQEQLFQNCPVSTGGWAIRLMIFLGCKVVATIGIDGITTEILAESSKDLELGSLGLRVDKTPSFNPNYFFSGYQQQGDAYQVPNNPRYEKNKGRPFHEDALLSIDNYVKQQCIDVEIFDLSPLSTHAIFKKMSFSEFRSITDVLVIFTSMPSELFDTKNRKLALKNNFSMPYTHRFVINSIGNTDASSLSCLDDFLFTELDCSNTALISQFFYESQKSLIIILNEDCVDAVRLIESAVISRLKGLKKSYFLDGPSKSLINTELVHEKPFWLGMSFFYNDINHQNLDFNISEFLDISMPAYMRLAGISVERILFRNSPPFYPILSHVGANFSSNNFLNLEKTIRSSGLLVSRYGKSLVASLKKLDLLEANLAWIGKDNFSNIWNSFAELLCYVAAGQFGDNPSWKLVKLDATDFLAGNIDEEQIFSLMLQGNFIEWEVSDCNERTSFKEILCRSQLSKELKYLLNNYPLQSFVNVSLADAEIRMILADTLIFIKSLLSDGGKNDIRRFSNRKAFPSYMGSFLGENKINLFKKIEIFNRASDNFLILKFRFGPLKIQSIKAAIELVSDTTGHINVRLCRDIGEQFEFSDNQYNLDVGSNEVSTSFTMKHEHAGFRLELCSSDLNGRSIQIKNLKITLQTGEYVFCEWDSKNDLADQAAISNAISSHQNILRDYSIRKYYQVIEKAVALNGKVNILDPDAVDERGHYIAYDRKLSQALEKKGINFNVLCRKDIESSILEQEKSYQATFSRHSWTIATNRETFHNELKQKIMDGTICNGDIVYFYTGSIYHVEVFYKLSREYPSISFNCNLFWEMIKDIESTDYKNDVRRIFLENRDIIDSVSITAPTIGVRNYIEDLTSIKLRLAPHPCTGIADSEIDIDYRTKEKLFGDRKRVIFPGADTKCKGYALGIAAASKLSSLGYDCWIRESSDTIADKTLSRIPNVMTDNDFKRFLASADVIVLPYETTGFKYRTSGIVIDALYLNVPVVVMKNTWLADIVSKYSTGYICSENPDEISNAVLELFDNYQAAISQLAFSKIEYHRNNSWSALADSIITSNYNSTPSPFKIANTLYRNGYRSFAKTIYTGLYDIHGMSIYKFNKILCDS